MQIVKRIVGLSQLWLSFALLLASGNVWIASKYSSSIWNKFLPYDVHPKLISNIAYSLMFLSLYSLILALGKVGLKQLRHKYSENEVLQPIFSLASAVKISILLVLINIASSGVDFSFKKEYSGTLGQINQIVAIALIGWCVFQLIQAGEVILQRHLAENVHDKNEVRRHYTHIIIIKRILVLLLCILTAGAMLMSFEKIRAAGTAIIASSGIFVTIASFSARDILASIFRGLQLAISQPVRLGDTVTVGGETGTVTSITLHHVVVMLGDRSQLIVPNGEFLDNKFRSWTHSAEDPSGTVKLTISNKIPIELIRKEFHNILENSSRWHQGLAEVQVSDFNKNVIELKLVMSAKNASQLEKLRYEVLEKMLHYMQTKHPESLTN